MAGKLKYDLSNKQFGYWNTVEYLGRSKYLCKCTICGYERQIEGYFLTHDNIPKCEHEKVEINLTNEKFGMWTALYRTASGRQAKWMCRCSCGTFREVLQNTLRNHKSTGCGCATNRKFIDMTNEKVYEWAVLRYNPVTLKWVCVCSCGKIQELSGYQLRSGSSKSCGHSTTALKDLTGMRFGHWKVIRKSDIQYYPGATLWLCRCSCGELCDVSGYALRTESSKSCGCLANEQREISCLRKYGVRHSSQIGTARTREQLKMIESRENLLAAIKNKFDSKPTTHELATILGLDRSSTMLFIHKYAIESFVSVGVKAVSRYEKELAEMFPCDDTSDRSTLGGKELDLLYKDRNLAIEFNGNYWHGEFKKHPTYHQEKSLDALKHGIRLIHIFEYEWNNECIKNSLIKYINSLININYLECGEVYADIVLEHEALQFIRDNSICKSKRASTYLGLYRLGELVRLIGINPCDTDTRSFHIVVDCCSFKTRVGGSFKVLMDYMIDSYRPEVVKFEYNIAKSAGDIKDYIDSGFDIAEVTQPNYVWLSPDGEQVIPNDGNILMKLNEAGFGQPGDYETELKSFGFYRIYDCGNLKFIWRRDRG